MAIEKRSLTILYQLSVVTVSIQSEMVRSVDIFFDFNLPQFDNVTHDDSSLANKGLVCVCFRTIYCEAKKYGSELP